MNNEVTAKKQIDVFLNILQSSGINVSETVKANYCFESGLQKGKEKAKLRVYFGSKGVKTVIQGDKTSDLYKKVYEIIFGGKLFSNEADFTEPEDYIGTDESGKGDYFGPLVIAGVYVKNSLVSSLKSAGVRDSKLVPDNQISPVANEIRRIVENKFSVVFISPAKYNELYEKFGNLNRLLAWGHSRVIENLLEQYETGTAVSDKFGDESLITNSLLEKGKQITLLQYHKAEKYTAVAAASILARDELNKWFRTETSKLGMVIPKGASAQVEKTAADLVKKYGSDILLEKAKLHFKTTKKFLGN
jgi:ribonuclease HIII